MNMESGSEAFYSKGKMQIMRISPFLDKADAEEAFKNASLFIEKAKEAVSRISQE